MIDKYINKLNYILYNDYIKYIIYYNIQTNIDIRLNIYMNIERIGIVIRRLPDKRW